METTKNPDLPLIYILSVSDFFPKPNNGCYQISATTSLLPLSRQETVVVNRQINYNSIKVRLPNSSRNRAKGFKILKLLSFLRTVNSFRKKVNKKHLSYKKFLSKSKYLLNVKKIDGIKLAIDDANSEIFRCITRERLNLLRLRKNS
jgi:hypothetical protein